MKTLYSRSIPCYASDTAGVCSALFELGGMIVVHDASGCNSTYATFDEPRWYHSDSMTYISALTEKDMVCGNDDKLIDDITRAALELHPEFIALCNSPIPLMVGCDMAAAAAELEKRLQIPAFAVPTSGMQHYIDGASRAWVMLAERFLPEKAVKKNVRSVNILGATPLDFSLNGNVEAIRDFLNRHSWQVQSCWAMGSNLDELKSAPDATLNLVISGCALPLAEYMFEKYHIPFVCGIPLGCAGVELLSKELETAYSSTQNSYFCSQREVDSASADVVIVGESIFAGSLARTLAVEKSWQCKVIDPLLQNKLLLADGDEQEESEAGFREKFAGSKLVIADNMYEVIVPQGTAMLKIPHDAFSGRCYHRMRLNLIDKNICWENLLCRR